MSTAIEGQSKAALNSAQREWLKKMGDVLNIFVRPTMGVDIPLAGVFPESLWEQRKTDVSATELMLKELEDTQLPNVPELRKSFDLVRSSEKQNDCSEALKAFDAITPKIKAEHERLLKSRLGGVSDLNGAKYSTGVEIGEVEGEESGAGTGKGKKEAAAKPVASAQAGAAADCTQYAKQVLTVGSKGPAVECLQRILGGGLGVDGKFGPTTQKAVKAFQKSKGLKDDGVVGEKTWTALGGGAAAGGAATPTTAKVGAPSPTDAAKAVTAPPKGTAGFISAPVGKGGKNLPEDVKAVQKALNERGSAKLAVDGKYGPPTQKAIEEFQKKIGQFKPDGLIKPGRGPVRVLSGDVPMPPTPPEPKPIAPPVLGKASLDKGAFVWHSTRDILGTNIEELKKGVRAAYGTEHPDLFKAIDQSMLKLNKVVDKLDTRLADALNAAYKAPSDAARVTELKKAEGTMKEYLQYVKSEPLIDHMDDNPFGVKTSLKKVISDALKHLSQLLPGATAA